MYMPLNFDDNKRYKNNFIHKLCVQVYISSMSKEIESEQSKILKYVDHNKLWTKETLNIETLYSGIRDFDGLTSSKFESMVFL